ncbi:MAG: hypothetical protein APF80_11945 [Alphaproteobacteria bacterium BRH_c36]|nr:MAG: hypothetical protein APF80_11945 [Alphaproteobacteria bacterium BRH_c36]
MVRPAGHLHGFNGSSVGVDEIGRNRPLGVLLHEVALSLITPFSGADFITLQGDDNLILARSFT